VVGVHVRLEQPLHLGTQLAHARDQAVGARRRGAAGRRVVIEHAVDQRALHRRAVEHEVAEGRGRRVEQRFDVQAGGDVGGRGHW